MLKRIPFSVDNGKLTVIYNSWQERNEVEKQGLHLHFKDVVYNGTDIAVPFKSEALRVYLTKCKRYYYYSVQQQGEQTSIYISGLPDFSKYCIHCEVKNNRMEITSFFHKLKDPIQKKSTKSVNFKGYGPRGMLLVKFIAMRMGVAHVDLKDNWEGTRHIKSNDLKAILQAHLQDQFHHTYIANKKKIDPWIAFFDENNTTYKAAQHGYYGGFGFEPMDGQDKLTAKPENIVCASCIYV